MTMVIAALWHDDELCAPDCVQLDVLEHIDTYVWLLAVFRNSALKAWSVAGSWAHLLHPRD